MTKGYTAVSLYELPERLRKPSLVAYRKSIDADPDKIELWGAKVPAVVLKTIGIVILAGCQLYLWLHTQELQRMVLGIVPVTWIVVWIGLYTTKTARAFVILSAALLSAGTVAIVVLKSWPDSDLSIRLFQVVSGTCSLALSALIVRTLFRLWASIDQPATGSGGSYA